MSDGLTSYNQIINEYKNSKPSSFIVNPSAISKRDSQSHAGMDAIQDNLKNWKAKNPSYEEFVTEEYYQNGMNSEEIYSSKMYRINYYRSIARHPDILSIIEDYKNEILIKDKKNDFCQFKLTELGEKIINEKYHQELKNTANYIKDSVLDFNTIAEDELNDFLIDGELFYEIELDAECKRVIGMRRILPEFIDPLYKHGEIIGYIEKKNEYDENGNYVDTGDIVAHHPANIVYINSGIFEKTNKNIVYSFLERARKPFNQLLSMESSLVIRRLTRSPLMNVFNVGVNKMQPADAEAYVKNLARTYKSKAIYDVNSGDFSNRDEFLTSIKNYWFPKYAGDEGTTISTESFDTDFDTIGDVRYFELKLYKAMGIPKDRYSDEGTSYNYDETAKQQREIVFNNKAMKWGERFTTILYKPFLYQLFLESKNDIIRRKNNFFFKLTENRIYKIFKELEILKKRIDNIVSLKSAFNNPDELLNDYYIMKKYLEMDVEEIKEVFDMSIENARLQYTMEKQIEFVKAKIDLEYDAKMKDLYKDEKPESEEYTEDKEESFGDMERDESFEKPVGGASEDTYEPRGLQMTRGSSKSDRPEIGGNNADMKTEENEVTPRMKDFDFDNREATAYDTTEEEESIGEE